MFQQLKAYCLKRLVRLRVQRRAVEQVKISGVIVALVAINMVHHFASLSSRNNAMFKHRSAPISSSPLRVERYAVHLVGLCCSSSGPDFWKDKMSANGLRYVPTTKPCTWLQPSNLSLVCKECIAVLPPHEIVTHAHFTSGDRAFAVLAIPADLFSAPSVLSGSMAFDPLVVHKAESMSRVLLFTPFNHAFFHAPNVRNAGPRYKALGNSWAVNVVKYIGQRIQAVKSLPSAS